MTSNDAPAVALNEMEPAPYRRDFELASKTRQMATVYETQMRIYSKSKTIYIFLFMLLLIPILSFAGVADKAISALAGNPTVSYLLTLLLIFLVLIPVILTARLLPSEFRNRTAYMNFPLPVSRTTFYLGKFFAALTLSIGIIMLAYAFAIISGGGYLPTYPNDVGGAIMVSAAAVFAFAATSYALSCYFKKGSMAVSILLLMVLPLLMYIVVVLIPVFVPKVDMDPLLNIWDYLKTMPIFAPYSSLNMIDGGFMQGEISALSSSLDPLFCVAVSVIWGVLFLLLGVRKINRMEV